MGRLTHTVSGSIATVRSPAVAPIESLKVHFSPIQAGTGDPSPSNIRPITGWTGVTGYKSGKNLIKETEYAGQFFNVSDGTDLKGTSVRASFSKNNNVITITTTHEWYGCIFATDMLKPGNYTIHTELSDANVRRSAYVTDEDLVAKERFSLVNDDRTITLTETSRIVVSVSLQAAGTGTVTNMQVEYGNAATSYTPYFGETIPVTFPVNTVYGGYVDLVTGNVVLEWDKVSYAWNEGQDQDPPDETSLKKRFQLNYPPYSGGTNNISNVLRYGYGGSYQYNVSSTGSGGKWAYVTVPLDIDTNLQIDFIYKLYEPVVIATITPQELATFKGYSNFWSNAGDVDVTYQVVESSEMTKERQKIFAGNAPSIHTASGSVANFEMEPGLNRNLKSCKVGFLPVQEGSGDPSPSNIRPITGWTGVTLYNGGKNLFDISTIINGKTLDGYGNVITNSSRSVTDFIILKPGTYTISRALLTDYWKMQLYDMNNTSVQRIFDGMYSNRTFTIYELSKIIIAFDYFPTSEDEIQLELSSTATSYEPYSALTSYFVSWESQGTIYGGYVDLVSGKVIATYKSVNLGDYNWGKINTLSSAVHNKYFYVGTNGELTSSNSRYVIPSDSFCSAFPFIARQDMYMIDNTRGIAFDNGAMYISWPEVDEFTVSEFKEWVNKYYLVAPLVTPIEYQLTPTQIQALKGTNNILSDANGIIEVKYWSH